MRTSGESAKAASDLGARAFTVGSDLHFAASQYQPGTKEGDRLLADELTHVSWVASHQTAFELANRKPT